MKEYNLKMLVTEVLPLTGEFAESLQSGETLSSVAITHTPPYGAALTPTPSASGTTGTVLFGNGSLVRGWHTLMMQATGSAGSKPEVVWLINVS